MIKFELKHPKATQEMLGYIPRFLDENNPESAKVQLNDNYQHGGGWDPFQGFKMTSQGLEYPGDAPTRLLADGKLREEIIRIYEHAWVAIVQPDGSYEISRMD